MEETILLIGRTTPNAPVPVEFVGCKQFDLPGQLDELVAVVQAANRLPIGRAPSTLSLVEARELVHSRAPELVERAFG